MGEDAASHLEQRLAAHEGSVAVIVPRPDAEQIRISQQSSMGPLTWSAQGVPAQVASDGATSIHSRRFTVGVIDMVGENPNQ